MYENYDDYINIELLIEKYESSVNDGCCGYFDVDEFEEIADYYINRNEFSKALKALNIALKQHVLDENLLLKKAQVYSYSSKPELALAVLENIDEHKKYNPEFLILLGMIYSQLNRPDDALNQFFEALDLVDEEEKDEVYLSIAFEYENLGDIQKAIKYLKLCLEANPENESALFELSLCYETLGSITESIKFFNDFLNNHPNSDSAWYCLGLAYETLEMYEKAILAYDYALAINEGLFAAYFNKANCYAALDKYEEALKVYDEILEFETPDALIFLNIAEYYEKLEKYSQAKIYYKKALEMDEECAEAWAGMAVVTDHLSNSKSAIPYIEKALNLNNDNADFWYIYGDLLQKAERYEEAQTAYYHVTSLCPENEDIWSDLADLQYNHISTELAIQTLKEGIKHHPENSVISYKLSGMLFLSGKRLEATRFLRESLLNDYNNHKILLSHYPKLADNIEILDLIDLYRK